MLTSPLMVIGIVTMATTLVRYTLEPYKRLRRAQKLGVTQVQPLVIADYPMWVSSLPAEHRREFLRQADRGDYVMYGLGSPA